MSATNSTTHYSLPSFLGSDKPAWLVDWNGAMATIDSAIYEAKQAADTASSSASAVASDLATLSGTVSTQGSTISTLSDTLTTAVGNINTINGNITTINSLIGNGTPTTTDQTIIGAINEINANVGSPSSASGVTGDDAFEKIATLNDLLKYSTSETVCGTWIDGSNIYRKCYVINQSIPADTYTSITSQTGIANLKDVISIRSQFKQGSDWISGVREVSSNITRGLWVQVNSSVVSGGIINTSAVDKIIIIVEYTKNE